MWNKVATLFYLLFLPVYFGQCLREYYLWTDGESEPIQIRVENVLELGRARTWDFPLNKKEGTDGIRLSHGEGRH